MVKDIEEVLDRVLAMGDDVEIVQDSVDGVHEDLLAMQGQIAFVGGGVEDVIEGVNGVQVDVAEVRSY